MDRPTRFEHHRFLGDKRTQVVHDVEHLSFVVVGMSFECATDNSLLTALGKTELLVESSRWIVVNPVKSALDDVCANLRSKLPGASVIAVQKGFAEWTACGLGELREIGVLESQCPRPA